MTLAALIRQGEDVQVLDHETRHDLTAAALSHIILEEDAEAMNQGIVSDCGARARPALCTETTPKRGALSLLLRCHLCAGGSD